jgi:SAM-dependent methyltransferase
MPSNQELPMSASPNPRLFPEDRWVGSEFRKSYVRRIRDGFMAKYLAGDHILDIGYKSNEPGVVPVTETATGVGLDYPGYDGTTLPFADESQDTVMASHVLEHIPNPEAVLAEWFRVLKTGGFLVLFLPHKYLYERRPDIPSLLNSDHRRGYTPASLLAELEASLPVNSYRIRHMLENDEGYRYDLPFESPPHGSYEIELVAQKLASPAWSVGLEYPEPLRAMIDHFDRLIFGTIANGLQGAPALEMFREFVGSSPYFTPWHRLREHFVERGAPGPDGQQTTVTELMAAVRPLLDFVDLDVSQYVALNPGLAKIADPAAHWRLHGYFEGRAHRDFGLIAHRINMAARNRIVSGDA